MWDGCSKPSPSISSAFFTWAAARNMRSESSTLAGDLGAGVAPGVFDKKPSSES
jgi:hypothetical protein